MQTNTKTVLAFAALASLGLSVASAPKAQAQMITFDDISNPAFTSIVKGYQGLSWNNVEAISRQNSQFYGYTNTGYLNGIASGDNVAVIGFASPGSITSATTFTFNSLDLTSAAYDGAQETLTGRYNGSVLFTKTVTMNASAPTTFTFNWGGINELDFSTACGGTLHPGASPYLYNQAIFDNLSINQGVTATPEPSSVAAFAFTGLGTLGLVLRARRRTQAAG